MFQSINKALDDVIKNVPETTAPVDSTHVMGTQDMTQIGTKHTDRCPICGATVALECRSTDKGQMVIYGLSGVRQVIHVVYRCQDDHCRVGLFYGYRVHKGGSKIYDLDCLAPENIFLGIT